MPCVFEQSYYIGFFYDLACIHNDDSIAHLCYYAHVMGNQKNRGVLPLFDISNQIEYLCLYSHI